MAYRTRRQNRYVALRKYGFLKFEAKDLSKVPFKTPYMKPFIKERINLRKTATRQKIGDKEYEATIKELYDIKKWFDRKGNRDVWKMLQEFEEKYKKKHPEYQSPWQKKRKHWKDFVNKVERTLAKDKLQ
jgi:hypothetical protein